MRFISMNTIMMYLLNNNRIGKFTYLRSYLTEIIEHYKQLIAPQ